MRTYGNYRIEEKNNKKYVVIDNAACPVCGDTMKHRDYAPRKLKKEGGEEEWFNIPRAYCKKCKRLRRLLPDFMLPYRQYSKDIISGVLKGQISEIDLEYEDYPCGVTIDRWKKDEKDLHRLCFASGKGQLYDEGKPRKGEQKSEQQSFREDKTMDGTRKKNNGAEARGGTLL